MRKILPVILLIICVLTCFVGCLQEGQFRIKYAEEDKRSFGVIYEYKLPCYVEEMRIENITYYENGIHEGWEVFYIGYEKKKGDIISFPYGIEKETGKSFSFDFDINESRLYDYTMFIITYTVRGEEKVIEEKIDVLEEVQKYLKWH